MAKRLPRSMDEYRERFMASHKSSGEGFTLNVHMPCPFCATPDWLVMRVLETEVRLAEGATCGRCGRSARAIVKGGSAEDEGMSFEMVQTGGADCPEWLVPPMRRVDDDAA